MQTVYAQTDLCVYASVRCTDFAGVRNVHQTIRNLTGEASLFQEKEDYLILSPQHAQVLPAIYDISMLGDQLYGLYALDGKPETYVTLAAEPCRLHAELTAPPDIKEKAEVLPVRLLPDFLNKNSALKRAVTASAYQNPAAAKILKEQHILYLSPDLQADSTSRAVIHLHQQRLTNRQIQNVVMNLRYLKPWELGDEVYTNIQRNTPFPPEEILQESPAFQEACARETEATLLRPHFHMRIRENPALGMALALGDHRLPDAAIAQYAQAMQHADAPSDTERTSLETLRKMGTSRGMHR